MSSTSKALELLSYFSVARPEIGLSQMCKIAGRDKATTYRYLQALETNGLIEQNTATRQYRLGPALLKLATVREATVPRKSTAQQAVKALSEATGETAHVTVLSNKTLFGLCENEAKHHAIRAVIDLDTFPLHATASGLCALAFGAETLIDDALETLESFTSRTPCSRADLERLVQMTRATGFARADKIYEDEIQGLAAPLYDQSGTFAGAVAVACVASRFTPSAERTIQSELIQAARDITRNWGGDIPAHVEAVWAKHTSTSNTLEHAS